MATSYELTMKQRSFNYLYTAAVLLIATCCHDFSSYIPAAAAFSPPHLQTSLLKTRSSSSSFKFQNSFDTARKLHHGSQSSLQLHLLDPTSSLSAATEAIASSISSLFSFTGPIPFLPSLALNTLLFFSLRPKLMTMLTPEGFAHSLALGTMLWTTLGWRGWTVCVLYLFLGQAVTKVGFDEKTKLGIAEGRGGRRGPENVWGSALTGVLCAAAASQGTAFLGISTTVWLLAYVASLATKLADTFASEIGKAYGKTTFLITSLQPVPRGTEGAISLEGTIASIVGGLLLSLYAYLVVGLIPSLEGVAVATLAAFVATMVESLIGATLQEKEGFDWMSNEVVNFFNTLIGAAIAIGLGVFVLGM